MYPHDRMKACVREARQAITNYVGALHGLAATNLQSHQAKHDELIRQSMEIGRLEDENAELKQRLANIERLAGMN